MRINLEVITSMVAFGIFAGSTNIQAAEKNGSAGKNMVHESSFYSHLLSRFDSNRDGKLQTSELPEKMATKISEVDLNKDGIVTEDEMKEHHENQAKEHFKKRDENGDGFLTESEAQAHWEKLRQADKNGDKKLSFDELKEWESGSGHHRFLKHQFDSDDQKGDPQAKLFQKFDKDGDEKIALSDLPAQVKEKFGRADSNKDGFLSKDEMTLFFKNHEHESFGHHGRRP